MGTTPHTTTSTTPADAPGPMDHTSYEEITSPARRFLRRQRIRECLARIGAVEYSRRHYSEYGFFDPGEMTGLAVSVVESGWLPDFDLSDAPWPELAPDRPDPTRLDGIHALPYTQWRWEEYISQLGAYHPHIRTVVHGTDGLPRPDHPMVDFSRLAANTLGLDPDRYAKSFREQAAAEWRLILPCCEDENEALGLIMSRAHHRLIEARSVRETESFLKRYARTLSHEADSRMEKYDQTLRMESKTLMSHGEDLAKCRHRIANCLRNMEHPIMADDTLVDLMIEMGIAGAIRRLSIRQMGTTWTL